MNKQFTGIALSMLLSLSAIADDTVTSDHKPNEYTLACLQAPTRDCAFNAALQTVIAEDFGAERAKVLVGVAEAMIATGQKEQALQTLVIALDEARSVNLSLVTKEKITAIAPLMALAGDVAGSLALTQELDQDHIRDSVLFHIAELLIQQGAMADASVALDQVSNQSLAKWRYLEFLITAPLDQLKTVSYEELAQGVDAIEDAGQKYRALVRLAVIADRMGQAGERAALLASADELFAAIVSLQMRAEAAGERARLMYRAGMNDVFVTESYELAVLHGNRVQGLESQANLARNIGPIEAAAGEIIKALKWMDLLPDVDAKARYLSSLPAGRDKAVLAEETRQLLTEIQELEGAYNRDLVRLILLEGAVRNGDDLLASQIITELEDDDNQALGLVQMAPLLS